MRKTFGVLPSSFLTTSSCGRAAGGASSMEAGMGMRDMKFSLS
jgi:hypothetical protein